MRRKVKKIWDSISVRLGKTKDVYFISGMCYNCSVFDDIALPKGYNKIYIEWEIPLLHESLAEYTKRMAKAIDPTHKFILVGYSFGGVIAQEITKFMNPEKVILISSMKSEAEIPTLFKTARKVNFAENLPMRLYSTSNFMINLFNRYVYSLPTAALGGFMTVVDPVYIRWSLHQLTHWLPNGKISNLYHIHGTRDQVFPYELISNDVVTIKGGDHLMVLKRAIDVSQALDVILKSKVEDKQQTA